MAAHPDHIICPCPCSSFLAIGPDDPGYTDLPDLGPLSLSGHSLSDVSSASSSGASADARIRDADCSLAPAAATAEAAAAEAGPELACPAGPIQLLGNLTGDLVRTSTVRTAPLNRV